MTTFNLPDLRGRVVFGVDLTETRLLNAKNVGTTGGNGKHKLKVEEIPSHSHGVGTLTVQSGGQHTHGVSDPGHNHGGNTGDARFNSGFCGMFSHGSQIYISGCDGPSHRHSIPVGYTGITINNGGSHAHRLAGETVVPRQFRPD